ncbi:hypothetical protein TGAMA5MH_10767 [Trichoderma gamsii]|uniref:CCHC-type domain-containing protein n=1 Tax=Trichoderma gamsii TaxID=398673 RepID=A0A2K0SVN4_9HYPO|nr:hypothetical protein TGAMA5MH_10767 [Trichoderma gamsii]
MIDNRQWERKQERKTEKNGQPHKHQPQANQGKKRDEYVAKDNGTRPGRMDIDDITKKKFIGTCNACGKKGHKEADCRSKMTCDFCGKKGHKEAYCYSKKNGKNPEATKDRARVDAIMEIPHDHLSWTACYDDSCLVHQSSKKGSGYYPKKQRAKKSHKTVRIDTLNFHERPHPEDFDCNSCEDYEINEYELLTTRNSTWKDIYECDDCGSKNPEHACTGCPECGSKEGFRHTCEAEQQRNMNEMYELFKEQDEAAKEYFEDLEKQEKKRLKEYECILCESHDLDHDCTGCNTCGSWDSRHDCSEVLNALVREHRRQEERRQYLKEFPPVRINPPRYQKIDISHAYDYITLPRTFHPSRSGRAENYGFNKDCGRKDWMLCDTPYCAAHVHDKLEDWHDQQIEDRPSKKECAKEHFLDCAETYCTKHAMIKHRFRLLTRALTKNGYNTITHEHKGQGNKTLIKEFHSMIEERIYDIKCKWCYDYQGRTWRKSHLGRININSIGKTKKLRVEGYINQHPVMTYVDSGADRNLITPRLCRHTQRRDNNQLRD